MCKRMWLAWIAFFLSGALSASQVLFSLGTLQRQLHELTNILTEQRLAQEAEKQLAEQLRAQASQEEQAAQEAQIEQQPTVSTQTVSEPEVQPGEQPRTLGAQETLEYLERGGEAKLTAAQQQELEAAAAKERKEQEEWEQEREQREERWREFKRDVARAEEEASLRRREEHRIAKSKAKEELAELEKEQEQKEKEEIRLRTRTTQFEKELTSLFKKTFATLKESKKLNDVRLWNIYLKDVLEAFKGHSALQAELAKIEKNFADLGTEERQELIKNALLAVMSQERDIPENSKTAKAIQPVLEAAHKALSQKEAKELETRLKLTRKEVARTGQVIEATRLPKELAGIVAEYDMPVFKGEKISTFLAIEQKDLKRLERYAEPHPVTILLALSPQQIALTLGGEGLKTHVIFVTIDGENPVSNIIPVGASITALGKMPDGQVLLADADYFIRLFDPRSQKEKAQLRFEPLAYDSIIRRMTTVENGVICGSDNGLSLVRVTREGQLVLSKLRHKQNIGRLTALAALADGRLAYSSFEFHGPSTSQHSSSFGILDLATGKSYPFQLGNVQEIVQLPNGNIVSVETYPNLDRPSIIKLWNLTGKLLKTIKTDYAVTALVALPDGRIVHDGSFGKDKTKITHALTVLDLQSEKSYVLDGTRNVSELALIEQEDEIRLFVGDDTASVSIWR